MTEEGDGEQARKLCGGQRIGNCVEGGLAWGAGERTQHPRTGCALLRRSLGVPAPACGIKKKKKKAFFKRILPFWMPR